MKLSIGIVGLPNVGKSTLFKILTKQEVNIANYPFTTINPNVGVVPMTDERLFKLAKITKSEKVVPAVVEFYDIAGLVKGAYKGEGLGNQFLSHIREVAAIVEVVRCFKTPEIIHIEQRVDSLRDLETINTELILKDLETVKKQLEKLESEVRRGDKQKIKNLEIIKKIYNALNDNILLFNHESDLLNEPAVKELNLLTVKPRFYLLNGEEEDVNDELKSKIKSLEADYLIVDLAVTAHLSELIKKTCGILGLISFFTFNESETRVWLVKKGTKAPQAAGIIHTDFEKKFIRAEVINWQKFLETSGPSVGSGQAWLQARQKGLIRAEGKDYIIQDGDVVFVRHS